VLRLLSTPGAVVVAVLALAGSAAAATDSYEGVSFSPFTMDAGNGDCIAWADEVVGPTRNCDPVNVLFPQQTLDVVSARLRRAQWTDTTGSRQWLYFADGASVAVQAQFAIQDPSDPTMRYHVRLWQAAPGLVVGSAHHEHGSPHQIDLAWDSAEAFLAGGLCASWCGHVQLPVQRSMEQVSGQWRGWANDATGTVIPLAPPAAPAAAPVTKVTKKKHHKKRVAPR
jgi:hypothetical protein